MPPLWHIELLGRLRLTRPGSDVVRFRTEKVGALLGYLAYHLPGPHAREALADLLWPDADPDAALHNLRAALSSLRRQLEPPGVPPGTVLSATRAAIGLNPEVITTDVQQLRRALAEAKRAEDPLVRAECLSRAVDAYGGPLLEGCYEEWVIPERERLAEAVLRALILLSRHHRETGDADAALDYGRRAVAMDPLREEGHRNLIRLYALAGHPDTALRHYHRLVQALRGELKVAPDPKTQALVARIRAGKMGDADPLPALDAEGTESEPVADMPAWQVATFLLLDEPGADSGTEEKRLSRELRAQAGVLVERGGTRCVLAFPSPVAALTFAANRQQESAAGETAPPGPPNVGGVRGGRLSLPRIALHTGTILAGKHRPPAPVLRHAACVLAAAHPGQVLLSEAAAVLCRPNLPPGVQVRDLGFYRLAGAADPERLYQASYPGMPEDLPAPQAECAYPTNLPPQLTRLFGREEEVSRLVALLQPPNHPTTQPPTARPTRGRSTEDEDEDEHEDLSPVTCHLSPPLPCAC